DNMKLGKAFKKGFLSDSIAQIYTDYKVQRTSDFLDDLKELGYTVCTTSGLTIGVEDIPTITAKDDIVAEARKKVDV
ncbi:hypothetical protein, partial [Lactobacillus paragasseri]|uniref:hypothetical protein n=1 Tax=Lactobacillus paragasseri TaxID=2107999 RepID=UPI00254E4807